MNDLIWKFLVVYVIKDSELLLINQDSRRVCARVFHVPYSSFGGSHSVKYVPEKSEIVFI